MRFSNKIAGLNSAHFSEMVESLLYKWKKSWLPQHITFYSVIKSGL